MEVFQHAISQMMILFVIIGFGFFARKIGYMNDSIDSGLSTLVMKFTLPAMILDSVLSNTGLPDNGTILSVFGYTTLLFLVTSVIAFVMVKLFRGAPRKAQGAYMFVVGFGNTGFIGFPIVASIFGNDALLYGAIYNIPYNLFMFSAGMAFIVLTASESNSSMSLKDQVKAVGKKLFSPVMVVCVLAMILALLRVTDDGFVGKTCELFGSMTVPAAMLIIGSSLAKMPIKEMLTDVYSYLATAGRLLVVPLVAYFLLSLFIQDSFAVAVIVVLSATPVATVGTLLTVAYGGDVKAMARCTFLTTVLSLVTLPLIALLVM